MYRINKNIYEFEIEDNSLSSESEDEEEDDLVSIQFKENNVKVNYCLLYKYTKFVREKYLIPDMESQLSEEIKRIQYEMKLKDSNINAFLQYFQNNSRINITNDNYHDFYKLSEYFKVKTLQKRLNKYAQSHEDDIEFNINIILEDISSNEKEENAKYELSEEMRTKLTRNINKCLENEKFNDLPINIIYDILAKCEETTIEGDLLFDFIMKSIDQRFVLFNFLDFVTLSDTKFEEMYKLYNEPSTTNYFQYLGCNLKFIKYIKETKQELIQQHESEKEVNILREKEQNEEIIKLKNQLEESNKICEKYKEQIEEFNNKLKEKELEHNEHKKQQTAMKEKYDLNQKSDDFCRGIDSFFGDPRNPSEALNYFEISSENGNFYSSYLAGVFYLKGICNEKNFEESIKYFTKSYEQGNSYGLYKLGVCYQNGTGVEQDLSKAIKYYEKASKLGNSKALNNLGYCYENAIGVEQDLFKAIKYYEKASKLGNIGALINLGHCYQDGIGVEQDLSKAIKYYEESSKLGSSDALYKLGHCYQNGIGVKQNISKAIEYYEESSKLGDSDAKSKLEFLKKK